MGQSAPKERQMYKIVHVLCPPFLGNNRMRQGLQQSKHHWGLKCLSVTN